MNIRFNFHIRRSASLAARASLARLIDATRAEGIRPGAEKSHPIEVPHVLLSGASPDVSSCISRESGITQRFTTLDRCLTGGRK